MKYYLRSSKNSELQDFYLELDSENGLCLKDDYSAAGEALVLSKEEALDLSREIIDRFQNSYPTEKMPVAELLERFDSNVPDRPS